MEQKRSLFTINRQLTEQYGKNQIRLYHDTAAGCYSFYGELACRFYSATIYSFTLPSDTEIFAHIEEQIEMLWDKEMKS